MLKKIASKEYPGYYEIVPTRISRVIGFFQSSRLTLRPIVIATMFFLSFLYFGAMPVKAALVSIASYILMVMPLGGRHLERIGLILFTAAATLWLDIIPIEQVTGLFSGAFR